MKKIVSVFCFILFLGCSEIREYSSFSTYEMIENSDDCKPINNDKSGKIKINTKRGFIKADVFDKYKKFEIDKYEYSYSKFSLFNKKEYRKSMTVWCKNGYKFYIEYGVFFTLNMPVYGDDYCKNFIFYNL